MNKLSWLIYLAGVSDRLGIFFMITAAMCAFAIIVWGIAGLMALGEDADSDFFRPWFRIIWVLLPTFLFSFLVHGLLPDKDSVYAIAASQVGEEALKTPLANKAEQAVEAWLNKQIADNTPIAPSK